jgi:hypothetical protein
MIQSRQVINSAIALPPAVSDLKVSQENQPSTHDDKHSMTSQRENRFQAALGGCVCVCGSVTREGDYFALSSLFRGQIFDAE